MVAGQTLPIINTWQSQIWINGFFAVELHPIRVVLCDLRPELRMQSMKNHRIQALAAEGRLPSPRNSFQQVARFRRLLSQAESGCGGRITANLTLYFPSKRSGR